MSVFPAFKVNKFTLSINQVLSFSTLFILLAYNQSFWTSLIEVVNPSKSSDILFLTGVFFLLFFVIFSLLSIISGKRTAKLFISIIFIASAITSYFMDSLGTIFDSIMIQNMMETDTHEALELINATLITHVVIFGLIPSFILFSSRIKTRNLTKEIGSRVIFWLSIFAVTSVTVYSSYKEFTFIFRENRELSFLINPIFPIRSVVKYGLAASQGDQQIAPVFKDASRIIADASSKKKLFIMVVGETARSQNFHLNGYPRNTTPNMQKRDVINFSNVSSCGTSTAVSVPCMFSNLTRDNFDSNEARYSENLLDALNIAGMNILWLDNNAGCKGVCNRIKTINIKAASSHKHCDSEGCFDDILLTQLQQSIGQLTKDTLIVLHQNGSHGPSYFKRYPEKFAKFKPECRTSTVQQCTTEEVINAYDNTILYTDHFISNVIDFLKSKSEIYQTGLLYVSDHGESLGENGVYLHGLPYFLAPEYQTKVPLILWLSEGFSHNRNINISCLKSKSSDALSHDNILHSILGVFDVNTRAYNPSYDLFSSCRSKANN